MIQKVGEYERVLISCLSCAGDTFMYVVYAAPAEIAESC